MTLGPTGRRLIDALNRAADTGRGNADNCDQTCIAMAMQQGVAADLRTENGALRRRVELAEAVTAETKRLMERRTTTLRERAERAETEAEPARIPLDLLCPDVPIPYELTSRVSDRQAILAELCAERDRQDEKFGEQNHRDGTGLPIYQHAARRYRGQTERNAASGVLAWRDVLLEETYEALAESDPARLRTELVQVAAVAVAWIEAIDRRTEQAGQ